VHFTLVGGLLDTRVSFVINGPPEPHLTPPDYLNFRTLTTGDWKTNGLIISKKWHFLSSTIQEMGPVGLSYHAGGLSLDKTWNCH
jgi:hypothetical protein